MRGRATGDSRGGIVVPGGRQPWAAEWKAVAGRERSASHEGSLDGTAASGDVHREGTDDRASLVRFLLSAQSGPSDCRRARVDFEIGQRVVVTGGYEMNPAWLAGGDGYVGTIVDIAGKRAVVELDDEIELHARSEPWKDFGDGTLSSPTARRIVRGRWLALGHRWEEPIQRVHVGLCAHRPDLTAACRGGQAGSGLGAWVESHATMRHARAAPPG
jgi:hypothetical protein